MKNSFIKSILALAVMLVLALPGRAAIATFAPAGTSTNVMITGPGAITYLTLTSATNGATDIYLYDNAAIPITNIVAAYTNYTPTVYTNTTYYTNIMDMWVSNGVSFFGANAYITNNYYYVTNLPVDPKGRATLGLLVTNTARLVGQWTIPAGTTVSVPFSSALQFTKGIVASNDGPSSVTVNYIPYK